MQTNDFRNADAMLLKNGKLLNLQTNQPEKNDLLIEHGYITQISAEPIHKNVLPIDCTHQVIVPGLIDLHVHFREPGFAYKEDLQTGAAAAMAGGFTTVCTMPNTNPAIDSVELIQTQQAKTRDFLVNVVPIAAITKGRQGHELADLAALRAAGAVGFSDDGSVVSNTALIRRALALSQELGAPIIEHCEDPFLATGVMHAGAWSQKLGVPGIPGIAEDVIVARDILLAEETGGKLHIAHISTARSVALVRAAKARGVAVTCEVAPHHFLLTDAALKTSDPNFKMNPPLRPQADVDALLEGLADGTIDVIASDHAPHSKMEKQAGLIKAPFGIIGLETMLPLAISFLTEHKILSLAEVIAKMTIQPARVLGIKSEIRVGEPANLTLFNPAATWQIDKNLFKSKARNSPFHGWQVQGKVFGVINQGKFWQN